MLLFESNFMRIIDCKYWFWGTLSRSSVIIVRQKRAVL
ncbi:unnamed protein product, partial [Allacma fusca]